MIILRKLLAAAVWLMTFPALQASAATEEDPLVAAPPASKGIEEAFVPENVNAVVLLDTRLHKFVKRELTYYIQAAAKHRQFRIAILPIDRLDDTPPEKIRAVLQRWHASRPEIEGVLFAGNVKLPSFFMPRPDIRSTRLWPRFYEDLDMEPSQTIPAGMELKDRPEWPRVAGVKSFTAGAHDYDALKEGPAPGAEWWVSFLPVGFQKDSQNNYESWGRQMFPFLKKAAAYHNGAFTFGRGLYLVSNDSSLLERARPVWNAVGPEEIEFYAINESGPGVFKNNPEGYRRVSLEKFPTLDAFLKHARGLPWMDEGWQSASVFLKHMAQSRRRIVWWNVHSKPEESLITFTQARDMSGGGLIALLNGCSVGGFRQPGSTSHVDTKATPEQNVLTNLIYGNSAFVAAIGSTHDRVTDEHGAPLFQNLFNGGYLGKAHLLRLQQADKDVRGNPMQLREFQEILIGDPFADAK